MKWKLHYILIAIFAIGVFLLMWAVNTKEVKSIEPGNISGQTTVQRAAITTETGTASFEMKGQFGYLTVYISNGGDSTHKFLTRQLFPSLENGTNVAGIIRKISLLEIDDNEWEDTIVVTASQARGFRYGPDFIHRFRIQREAGGEVIGNDSLWFFFKPVE